MTADTLKALEHPDERKREDQEDLEDRFVRTFRRPPDSHEVRRFRQARASLALRLPLRGRRTIAAVIASI